MKYLERFGKLAESLKPSTDLAWIGVDWGTTNLRVFAADATGQTIDEKSSDLGMAKLESHQFESALLSLIEPWLSPNRKIPVYASGMVGAKQGWREAEYRRVPCEPVATDGLTHVPTRDNRISVHILPGLSQLAPMDVMRGEETQIAGFMARDPDYSGAICLPGTHSKWVSVSNGKVESFTTFMTGEVFNALSNHTILRHSMGSQAWGRSVLLAAALQAAKEPQSVAEGLFGLRAASLLDDAPPEKLRSRFSGMLIGQELGLSKRYWLNQKVILIGGSVAITFYEEILKKLGCKVEVVQAKHASLAGLAQIATRTLGRVKYA